MADWHPFYFTRWRLFVLLCRAPAQNCTQDMLMPTPVLPPADVVFDTLFAYQRSAALKSGIDLDLFTMLDEGAKTVSKLAAQCDAAERGIRILCDYLVVLGLLRKDGDAYGLVPESAAFLSRRSPANLGSTASFLLRPEMKRNFDQLTEAVKRGGVDPAGNTVADENPIWVECAHAMVPMMMPAAHAIAELVGESDSGPIKVLDIAASHGMCGLTIAQRNPQAQIVGVDWKPVLAVAEANFRDAQLQDRFTALPGDAFKVDFREELRRGARDELLAPLRSAELRELPQEGVRGVEAGGKVVLLEFVPNPDRVSPPIPAAFSLSMLAGTPNGDAYTLAQLSGQFDSTGFRNITTHALPTPQTIVIAER